MAPLSTSCDAAVQLDPLQSLIEDNLFEMGVMRNEVIVWVIGV